MKKAIIILFALILVLATWLTLRKPKTLLPPGVPYQIPAQVTNAPAPAQVVATPPQITIGNTFVRPDYIDEGHWNQLMLVRQLALEENQPIEFYARIVDQNEQPVEGAKLTLKVTRTDEKMFATTNFFSSKAGDEVLEIIFDQISDSNGWIQVTGTNGSFLDLIRLRKEGYSSSYPDGIFGGVHYEPRGVRTPIGDILMTNAWNPQKGYILHLQKTGGK